MKPSDWINIDDKLPRTPDYVFVCRERGGKRWTSLAAYVRFEECARWYDTQGFDIYDVTHWQKIVLPNKKSKKYEHKRTFKRKTQPIK